MEYLYLLAGLVLILAGANYLTDGSVALAERFRVPGFLIGLTIVAVGTSTPELVVSFLSALEGEGDMAVGNVVGSNLFNVFIILGVCALIRPLPLTRQNIRRDLPVGVAASLVLCAVLADEVLDPTHPARIGRIEGLAMLLLYVLSVWTAARAARKEQPAEDTPAARPIAGWLMTLMIVAARTGLVGRLGRQGPARHRAGQRRGIEHRQHPAHPGALFHRRPAHAGRHRRRDAGCRRP